MSNFEYSFELEAGVDINYSVDITEHEPMVTNPDAPGFGPGVEGGADISGVEIVITSESIVDHMAILGSLADNYSDEDIQAAALSDWEENQVTEPDCEPDDFDADFHYKDMP